MATSYWEPPIAWPREIGCWANGEAIDVKDVPPVVPREHPSVTVVQVFSAQNGGDFEAEYWFERHEGGAYLYRLSRVREVMPPLPPQARGFTESVRIPMATRAAEVKQRRREWAEVTHA